MSSPTSPEEVRKLLLKNAQKRVEEAAKRHFSSMTTPEAAAFGKRQLVELEKRDPDYFEKIKKSYFYYFGEAQTRDRNYSIVGKMAYARLLLLARQRHAIDMRSAYSFRKRKPRTDKLLLSGVGRTEDWVKEKSRNAKLLNERVQSDPLFARKMRKLKEHSDITLERFTRQRRFHRSRTGI